jgi:putative addiction module CopG family antidote
LGGPVIDRVAAETAYSNNPAGGTLRVTGAAPPVISNPFCASSSLPHVTQCSCSPSTLGHIRLSSQLRGVTLPHELADMVRAKVASGEYAFESVVIREGLRALGARERAVEAWATGPGGAGL